MSKTLRSPLTGYNHNVQYLGRVFHVQTEDSGPVNPHIFTHLFFGGTILVSKKHRYEAATPDETVRKLMQAQHKAMLRELVQAQHDERIRGFFAAKGEILPQELPGAQPAATMATVESHPLAMDGASLTPPPVAVEGLTPGPRPSPAAGRTPSPVVVVTPPPVAAAPAAAPMASAQPAAARVVPSSNGNQRLPQAANRTAAVQQVVRSPFARSGANVVTASADGVVIQRSVVVGTRPRTPQETPQASRTTAALRSTSSPAPTPASAASQASAQGAAAAAKSSRGVTPAGQHSGSTSTPAWGAAVTPTPTTVRPIGPLVDDKSLDEVILEYLADDGVDEGLG